VEREKEPAERERPYDRNLSREVIEDTLSRRKRVVEHRDIERIRYNLTLVPCGKKRCKKCPHGPYWYAVRWHGNKRTEIYIGKTFKTLDQYNLEKKFEKMQKDLAFQEAENQRLQKKEVEV